MTDVTLPWSVLSDYRCFGCSPDNRTGLRLRFEPHPDGLASPFRLSREFESYPGVVHGGLIGVICDETMGNLIVLHRGESAFTVSMRQRFVSPLAVDRDYTCVARLRPAGSEALYHADAEVIDEQGTVCATASAVYQPFPIHEAGSRMALNDHDLTALTAALARLNGDRA